MKTNIVKYARLMSRIAVVGLLFSGWTLLSFTIQCLSHLNEIWFWMMLVWGWAWIGLLLFTRNIQVK